jgi:3-oxoacyl-[acyl-carrier-protein] synthase II
MTRRVVITGLGTVNPLAAGVAGYWQGLLAGKSAISNIELFDTAAFKVRFAGEVKRFAPEDVIDSKMVRRLDRFAQFALVASSSAPASAGCPSSRSSIPASCKAAPGASARSSSRK